MMTTTRRWRRRRVCLFIFVINMLENLRTSRRRRLAGAETSLRDLQGTLNPRCDRVRAAKHASRDRFYLLERRHGLAEIVERGTVLVASGDATMAAGKNGTQQPDGCPAGLLTVYASL